MLAVFASCNFNVHVIVQSNFPTEIIRSFLADRILSVVPLARCVVCLSVCLSSSSVCDVLYCGETVRPSEKLSEGVNRKPGSES